MDYFSWDQEAEYYGIRIVLQELPEGRVSIKLYEKEAIDLRALDELVKLEDFEKLTEIDLPPFLDKETLSAIVERNKKNFLP